MVTSRTPLVEMGGSWWLGDPFGRGASIEIAEEFIGLYRTVSVGSDVEGWARKHQAFGYPVAETNAVKELLQRRIS